MILAALRAAASYFNFDQAPCQHASEACPDCYSLALSDDVVPECAGTLRVCGHHCDCSWTFGVCCWCGMKWGH